MFGLQLLQMALYEAVLLQNDLDPEFVRSLNEGDASFSDGDEDDTVELASAAGDEDAVPSESGDDVRVPSELGDDSAVPGEGGDEAPESSHTGEAEGTLSSDQNKPKLNVQSCTHCI